MSKCKYGLIAAAQLLISALIIITMVNPVRADRAKIDAFQVTKSGTMPPGTEGLNLTFTVPTGKQLVIQYVSGNCFVPSGQRCTLSVYYSVSNVQYQFDLITYDEGPNGSTELFQAGQQVTLYASSGTIVTLRADRNASSGTANITFMSLSGYLQ